MDCNRLLRERRRWLDVRVTRNDYGEFDVTLKLAGSYDDEVEAEGVADDLTRQLLEALQSTGVPIADLKGFARLYQRLRPLRQALQDLGYDPEEVIERLGPTSIRSAEQHNGMPEMVEP